MSLLKKIGVIGNSDSIKGFAALGLSIFEADDAETAAKTVRQLAENDFAIIYITEYLFSQIQNEVLRYEEQQTPAIIPIPGTFGNNGIGMSNVSRSVERAVGSDILSNE